MLVDYRPFDARWTIYNRHVLTITRREVMRHLLDRHAPAENVALVTSRAVNDSDFAHCFVVSKPVDKISLSSKTSTNAYVFPLYVKRGQDPKDLQGNLEAFDETDGYCANLASGLTQEIEDLLNLRFVSDSVGNLDKTFGPEDVFHYAYAVFHSPAYRERYEEFLKRDFPRLPLTSDLDLFSVLSQWGEELVALHLMRSPLLDDPLTTFPKSGSKVLDKTAKHDPEKNRVYINKEGQYFDNVPEETWNFRIGGYQVLQKWLKYRKGRNLSEEDIEHYKKVVKALHETARIMQEIDEVIEAHGGWPLVGSIKEEQEVES